MRLGGRGICRVPCGGLTLTRCFVKSVAGLVLTLWCDRGGRESNRGKREVYVKGSLTMGRTRFGIYSRVLALVVPVYYLCGYQHGKTKTDDMEAREIKTWI